MSTCAVRLIEIRGDSEERVPRASWRLRERRGRDGRGSRRNGRRGCRRSSESTDLADSAGHDDEGAGGESRAVGIKSSSNIGVSDRRGRELINCRNGGYGGARKGKKRQDRKAAEETGNRR